jgi:hypothetical protein
MRRLILCALAIGVPVVGHATVLVPIEFRELVTSAPVIVHGRVVDVHAEWIEGRRSIETLVTIEASEYLKGDLGGRVTIRVPGGRLGRYRTIFIGAPSFQEGDEVVLFLRTAGRAVPWILGLSQGAFRIVADPASGRQMVASPVLLSAPGAHAETVVRGDARRRPLDLDAFRAVVRQVLAQ